MRFLTLFLLCFTASEASADRKVACPAQCAAEETADSTQQCVWHDKELYKGDGIGCRKYETVCWCKKKRQPLPPKTKL